MNNLSLLFILALPAVIAAILPAFRRFERLRKNSALAVFLLSFVFCLYLAGRHDMHFNLHIFGQYFALELDKLSRLTLVLANLLGLLICLFSKDYLEGRNGYFSWLLLLLSFTNLEMLAGDFKLFLIAWAGSIICLYALLRPNSKASANKAAGILGFSYLCFLAGVCIYTSFSGSNSVLLSPRIFVDKPLIWAAFLLMAIGGLSKAGSGPFHTWIPAASETAPVTVMALLPASLDKLLGIYILSRICLDFFSLNNVMVVILLVVGGLTIIFAVLMALVQHDARKLLAYHAVSQAGYMVLGLGTASPVGIIGAVFHMFNNAIYKSGLFLVSGAVEKKTRSFDLASLGGLARYMPATFFCALILSLSISGVPPFNGFASKWMIYQGAVAGLTQSPGVTMRFAYLFALVAAMFGSALTLASFVKFIHAIFLGQDNRADKAKISEAPWQMLLPLGLLAALCVLLGAFSHFFIQMLRPCFNFNLSVGGEWDSLFATAFIGSALVAGAVIWAFLPGKNVRLDDYFAGGESGYGQPSFPATEFYRTVAQLPFLGGVYRFLQDERFDLYNILVNIFSLRWLKKGRVN